MKWTPDWGIKKRVEGNRLFVTSEFCLLVDNESRLSRYTLPHFRHTLRSLSHTLSLTISLSLNFILFLSHCVFLSHSLWFSSSLTVYLCHILSDALSLSLSIIVSHCIFFTYNQCIVSIFESLFHYLHVFVSLFLFKFLCLSYPH